jgi:TonB family protein
LRRSAVLLALLCAACTRDSGESAFANQLAQFDANFQSAEASLRNADDIAYARTADMRGRTMVDDLERWVLAPATVDAIRRSRDQAARRRSMVPLEEALKLLNLEVSRRNAIQNYWRAFPAPFWREHWRRFWEANALAPRVPPGGLLDAERRLVAYLDAGEFRSAAGDAAPRLVTELRAALREAIPVVKTMRERQKLDFFERGSPCGAVVAPDPGRAVPRFTGGPPVEDFYPKDSANRGDEGAVVLRLKISDKGCVRSGAILVHSGFHELDAAALQWMETAEYSPGFENGRSVAGLTSIKVLFKLED